MNERASTIAKLWRRGVLIWKLRPEQKTLLKLIDSIAVDLAVFNISRRLGKSTTCATYSVEQALRKKQKILYSTAFLSDLENFICPIFEWVLTDCPDDLRPIWKASKKEYHFRNGSVIKLVGLDKNANALRGNNIDLLIVDEAAFIKNLEYLYRSIIVPATMKRKFKLIFPSTPPESPEHFWSKELIPKAKAKNSYVELTIDAISDLPASERQRLLDEVGGEFSITAQREFFCKILVDTNRCIAPSFNKDIHVQALVPSDIKWMLFGDSGGVQDLSVFLEAGWCHRSGRVIFRSELWFNNNTPTSVIVAKVKEKWPDHLTLILDATGQLLIDYSSLGLPAALPAKDDFGAGLLLFNNAFYNNHAIINPECELLIRTIEGGLLNKQRTDYERSQALGHCDAAAAAIYALRCVDRVTDLRPKPKRENIFFIPKDPEHIKQIKGLAYG
jgi:hypothetical protein